MIIYESKREGTDEQYERLDAAIRTARFVRNSIIRAWIDGQIKSRNKELTGRQIGLDVGLNHFYTDNFGDKVDNPRFLYIDQRLIKRLHTSKNNKQGATGSSR